MISSVQACADMYLATTHDLRRQASWSRPRPQNASVLLIVIAFGLC